jgi:hypothetical protein
LTNNVYDETTFYGGIMHCSGMAMANRPSRLFAYQCGASPNFQPNCLLDVSYGRWNADPIPIWTAIRVPYRLCHLKNDDWLAARGLTAPQRSEALIVIEAMCVGIPDVGGIPLRPISVPVPLDHDAADRVVLFGVDLGDGDALRLFDDRPGYLYAAPIVCPDFGKLAERVKRQD